MTPFEILLIIILVCTALWIICGTGIYFMVWNIDGPKELMTLYGKDKENYKGAKLSYIPDDVVRAGLIMGAIKFGPLVWFGWVIYLVGKPLGIWKGICDFVGNFKGWRESIYERIKAANKEPE